MKLTRRDFLKLSSVGIVGTLSLVAGCTSGEDDKVEEEAGSQQIAVAANDQPSVESVETNAKNVTVSLAVPVDPASFAPYGESNTGRTIVLLEMYEQLFQYSEFGKEMLPWVASGYEWTGDNNMTIRIKLHDNVFDRDGNHYTADDVIFFFKQYEAEGYTGSTKYIEGGADGIVKVDEYTLDFPMNTKNVTVFYSTFNNSFVFTQKAYEAAEDKFAKEPFTTAQYVLTEYVGGASYTVEKNADYWAKDIPAAERHPYTIGNADKVIYNIITDTAQTAIALETGVVDIVNTVAASEIGNFLKPDGTAVEGYTVASMKTNPSYYLCFNASEKSILNDVKLRQAVCWAIDNQEVVDIALEGNGDPSVTVGGNMYAGVSDAMREAAKSNYYSCNVDKAKELLAEAGYPDGIEINLMCSTEDALSKTAQILQLQLAKANITAKINQYEAALYNTYKTDINSGWDATVAVRGNSSGYVQAVWNGMFAHSATPEGNLAFVQDQEAYDGNLALLEVENATEENVLAFYNDIFVPRCYWYGLFTMMNYYAAQEGVTSIRISSIGNVMPSACGFADDYVSATEK